ncbi:MAG: hypothetical protein LBL26_02090 [Peptococcaceae bacterium]|nr:hypothetical protein [Peptococcaceae bacterium]
MESVFVENFADGFNKKFSLGGVIGGSRLFPEFDFGVAEAAAIQTRKLPRKTVRKSTERCDEAC